MTKLSIKKALFKGTVAPDKIGLKMVRWLICTDLDSDPAIHKQKNKKNFDFWFLLYDFFFFEECVNKCTFKKE
jgi:hypothetical protein